MLLRVSSAVLIAVVADLSTMYGYGAYGCTLVSVHDKQKPFDIQITGYVGNTGERPSRYQGPTSPAQMSAEQFWAYCRYNNWSNHTILNKASWYIFPSFVAVAEQLPEYEAYLHTFYKKYRRYRRRDMVVMPMEVGATPE